MAAPRDPNVIIIRNEYYPDGLKEERVWNYYLKNKNKIIKEAANRPIIIFLFVSENNSIILRRTRSNESITLNKENYEKVISGRSVSLSVENIGGYYCIDIDSKENVKEEDKKQAVQDILDIYKKLPEVKKIRVTSSSSGYHVYGYLVKQVSPDTAINILKKHLEFSLKDKYGIGQRIDSSDKDIVLDFAPMYSRGSHTLPGSLNRNGTICLDITKNWKTFDRISAKI